MPTVQEGKYRNGGGKVRFRRFTSDRAAEPRNTWKSSYGQWSGQGSITEKQHRYDDHGGWEYQVCANVMTKNLGSKVFKLSNISALHRLRRDVRGVRRAAEPRQSRHQRRTWKRSPSLLLAAPRRGVWLVYKCEPYRWFSFFFFSSKSDTYVWWFRCTKA